ncbi:GNAT family N-acetyltransferase [Tritonibacter mobilis]|uniref:GNAT family N-acetyltransferase n=1 Tax=Tritonibacter mobilis TaxID=379347 RepID=UPI0039A54FBD
MTKLHLSKEDGERRGRYVARLDGIEAEAEITFRYRSDGIISAEHTGVPDAMGGHGVAKALLDFMLEDARRSGYRIIPICPFVRRQYAKHPEWSDLFTTKTGEDP